MRRALFVGINYTYTEFPLRGCHKDVENMHAFFHQRFPEVGEVKVLSTRTGSQPTRSRPRTTSSPPCAGSLPTRSRAITSSSTTSATEGRPRTRTVTRMTASTRTLLPLDYEENGEIHDDELLRILCKNLPKGSVLTAIFDCCHSGTMMDLPYTYLLNQKRRSHHRQQLDAASKKLLEGSLAWLNGDKEGAMRAAMESMQMIAEGATVSAQATEEGLAEASQKKKETQGTVIQWSGCKDDQTSADTKIGNMPTGAMSWALHQARHTNSKNPSIPQTVNENPDCTFLDALKNVRALLRDEYTQIPQPMGF
ncbi:peptidase C14, caspase domain-containing protein [Zopfochytrium polystomum]|nr:peptidase C14, caspase domain-containing protein [Zopfochytrium polystomum]